MCSAAAEPPAVVGAVALGSLNKHARPICICPCYADRLIAMQPKALIEKHCGAQQNTSAPEYLDCHCATNHSVLVRNNSESLRFVGAMQVQVGPQQPPTRPNPPYAPTAAPFHWSALCAV